MASTPLIRYDAACRALAEAHRIDEVKGIRDKAVAMQAYARQAKDTALIRQATEIRMRAERRAGELLTAMAERGERQGDGRPGKRLDGVTVSKLSDLGVSKIQSSRWQKLAALDPSTFESKVAHASEEAYGRITGRLVARSMHEMLARRGEILRAEPPPLPGNGPYRVIVVDPAWPYGTRYDPKVRRGGTPYPEMSLEQICTFPVASIAHDDCILWLWTTNRFMREAYIVLDAWGFAARTILTWGKDRFGTGDWLRGQTEHCIMAVRGRPIVTLGNQSTLLLAPVRGHSVKPPEFYDLVERLCPAPRYADLFSRYQHNDKWECHGDEAPVLRAEFREAAE